MKLLLDHCVPRQLWRFLPGHDVRTTRAMGWAALGNGHLLQAAAGAGFDAFITVDRNLSFQQNPENLPLPVIAIVAPNNRLDTLSRLAPAILDRLAVGVERNVYIIPWAT